MPQISVIVPVYNAERYLHRCVDSILSQTFSDFELLLINDGSKDSSGVICDEYAAKDPRVSVFHKENGGVSSARNLGLDNAKGEWITFVDADDRIDAGFILSLSENAADCNLVIGKSKIEIGNESHLYFDIISDKYDSAGIKALLTRYSYPVFTNPWGKLFQKDIIDKMRLRFNTSLSKGEDSIFVYNFLLEIETLYIVSDLISYYHYYVGRSDSLSNNFSLSTTFEFSREFNVITDKLYDVYGIPKEVFVALFTRGTLSSFFPNDFSRLSFKKMKMLVSEYKCNEDISKIFSICQDAYCGKKAKIFLGLFFKNIVSGIYLWVRLCDLINKKFI